MAKGGERKGKPKRETRKPWKILAKRIYIYICTPKSTSKYIHQVSECHPLFRWLRIRRVGFCVSGTTSQDTKDCQAKTKTKTKTKPRRHWCWIITQTEHTYSEMPKWERVLLPMKSSLLCLCSQERENDFLAAAFIVLRVRVYVRVPVYIWHDFLWVQGLGWRFGATCWQPFVGRGVSQSEML